MLQTMVAGVPSLHNKNEIYHWDNHTFPGVWVERNNQKTDVTRNRTIKKKCKRVRTAFTTDQLRALEKTFRLSKYINSENRLQLSKKLNIGEKCIKIWFQNRRMKEKRESSESSDSSSETLGSEVMPSLAIQPESDAMKYDLQYNQYETPVYNEPYVYYQSPDFQTYGANNAEVPLNSVFTPINDYSNGLIYSNEMNPISAQHPSVETDTNDAYVCQNQYGNGMYRQWCANNMDSYNFYQ